MARPVRIEFPGALYHITARGNKKENILNSDRDRMVFLQILNETVIRYHFICYAYCLMPNHYHLLIETPNGKLSLGIRELNGVYAQKLNWAYKTVGHVFQGRFKAILVEKESYLLELCRYIVLNPVRAGFVQYPWEWQWSSYLATTGKAEKPKFLSTEWILSQFHEEQKRAKKSYEDFVFAGLGKEAPWKDLRGGFILGKDQFVEEIEQYIDKKKTIREVPKVERFVARKKLTEIFNEGKRHQEKESKIYSAHVEHGYTQKEIANYLGVHYSTVSKALKKFIEKNSRKDSIQESRPDPNMIKNQKLFEQFEKNLIRNSPIDFYQNLRIVDEMHQLALFLGVFKENQPINWEEKIRYARAINFASKTP